MASRTSGYSGIGQILHDLNEFIFVKNKKITSAVSVVLIVGLTFFVFNSEASAKASEMLTESDILEKLRNGGRTRTFPGIKDKIEMQTTSNVAGELSEGESSEPFSIENTKDKVLKYIKVEMTWKDESDPPGLPKLRNYENEPDDFTISVISSNKTTIISKVSDTGSINEEYTLTVDEMEGSYDSGNFSLEVRLNSAGDWVPQRGIGLITYTDNSNTYEIVITMIHLEDEE